MKSLLRGAGLALAMATPGLAVEAIDLWPEGVPGQKANDPADVIREDHLYHVHRPRLHAFLPRKGTGNGTAIVLFPGGGYVRLPVDTGAPDGGSQWLNRLGVAAFVVTYRLGDAGSPAPLQDAARAIRLVRSRAKEFGIDPERVGVMGGSAGGHVAAWISTCYGQPEANTGAPLDRVSARPVFAILQYPVITMEAPYAHMGSRKALLGNQPTEAVLAAHSLERRVTADTPPSFIVSTEADRSVPLENAMMYYEALMQAHVPAELHLYELGPHGFGMRPGLGDTSLWPQRCETWLRSHGWVR